MRRIFKQTFRSRSRGAEKADNEVQADSFVNGGRKRATYCTGTICVLVQGGVNL